MNSISTLWIANNGNPAIMSNALMRPKEYTITLQKREKDEEETKSPFISGEGLWVDSFLFLDLETPYL